MITASTRVFTGIVLIFLLLLFVASMVEIGLGFLNHSLERDFLNLLLWSCYEDIRFFMKWLLPVYLIFLPLHLFLSKLSRSLLIAFLIVVFMIQLLLIFYFNATLVMLGSDIYGYSIEEILQTTGSSSGFTLVSVLLFCFLVVALTFSLIYGSKRLKINPLLSYIFPIASLVFLVFGTSEKLYEENFRGRLEQNLVVNKSAHFYEATYSYLNPEVYEVDIYADSYLKDLEEFPGIHEFSYVDETEYPFLHKSVEADVLSPFFLQNEKKPNIVLILVEGLGRAFTIEGAYLGNFTPFLDSLSRKSLYWPNFLSNGGRTFAVLPSVLGSLPFAENGFIEMEENMPEHLSLLNLLKANDYRTSFYYGGNAQFDKMETYLKHNNIDQIIDETDFPPSYKKIPASASGFTWGYGDKELFRYYLERNAENSPNSPKLDILLTVSTHDPFITDEKEKYNHRFEQRMSKLGFNEEKKKVYRNYSKQYTSILFADDALKNLMEEYKRMPDFENTIFIITGDHRIPEIPMASKIDRYHVPLIIYSPMLKRSGRFEAISSHFDISPSLISYLKNNFDINAPETNAFLGYGLDTLRTFRNIRPVPLMQTKTEIIDFVMGEYHLNGDKLYRLHSDFSEELVTNETKKKELEYAFNQFKRKNAEIVQGKKLLPDSIIRKYISN